MVYTLIDRARLNLGSLNETYSERAARAVYDAEQTARRGKAMKMDREKEIVKISMIGILVNAVLVAFKLTVGALSHSIAIILDGVNNLTDALSSVVTIVGTKLAGRTPDKN